MIVGVCSTYNEGRLAAGAVACLLDCCAWVQVCDGPIRGREFEGPRTELAETRRLRNVDVWEGVFDSEIEKRNEMLARAKRRRYPPGPVWLLYLDGDELLLGARWVPDLIEAAAGAAPPGEEPGAIPLPLVDADARSYSLGLVYRIFRADLIQRHVVSMSQYLMTGSSAIVTLPVLPIVEGQNGRRPLEGEPHILHRAYYRPRHEERTRLSSAELDEFRSLERAAGFTPSGAIPVEREASLQAMEIDEQAILRELGVRPR